VPTTPRAATTSRGPQPWPPPPEGYERGQSGDPGGDEELLFVPRGGEPPPGYEPVTPPPSFRSTPSPPSSAVRRHPPNSMLRGSIRRNGNTAQPRVPFPSMAAVATTVVA
jgi:hypothetical protein